MKHVEWLTVVAELEDDGLIHMGVKGVRAHQHYIVDWVRAFRPGDEEFDRDTERLRGEIRVGTVVEPTTAEAWRDLRDAISEELILPALRRLRLIRTDTLK